MTDLTTREEAREGIRSALLAWRADGVANPLIPVYSDTDGDGIPDFYGLDDNGQLIQVSGATVDDSVAVSDGSGTEQKVESD